MNTLSDCTCATTNRGKWSDATVPKSGWSCVNWTDLGVPQVTCEMCDAQTIRYVHHMQHPGYKTILQVGCVCAGRMEGDIQSAQSREKEMQSRATARQAWAQREWKRSQANGNQSIHHKGCHIIIFRSNIGTDWMYIMRNDRHDSYVLMPKRPYPKTELDAKLAAYDEVTRMLISKRFAPGPRSMFKPPRK